MSHDLIPICLDRMKIPANVRDYIVNLYGRVRTSEWVSEEFKFNKGVFQGDPLSLIIFLACFNPVIEFLKEHELADGYDLNGVSFITLPFADDFNLITCDVRKHRRLMSRLHALTSSMGLKLKPRKCRSLSIKAGKSQEIVFCLGNDEIQSILHDRYHKFLGGIYTYCASVSSVAGIIKDRMSEQLRNIDSLLVRNEYKVRIYADYFLGSLRFILSIHDLHTAQIRLLDALSRSFLKKWLGLPRCASWALVHDSHGLGIKSIDHLYKECRALNVSSIHFFSDDRVRHALRSKEDRESTWQRKFSSVTFV